MDRDMWPSTSDSLLLQKSIFYCVSGRSGWSDSTDTVQGATTEANVASTEPRRRHGKGLNIRYPKVTLGERKSQIWGQKGLRYKLRLNKIEKGKHSDLRTRNSTLKWRSRQAYANNKAQRVRSSCPLIWFNSIRFKFKSTPCMPIIVR